MHYLDTSVLTGYYCVEERSPRVQSIMSSIEGPNISQLVEVEFHCAVARKVRAGAMDHSEAVRIFSEFQRHLAEPRFSVVAVRSADYALARDWIGRLVKPLRVLDAIHLAVAFSNGLTLVTADKNLAASARRFGIKHKLIS
jgi:hypothetical protein